jgi:hypothetical protein
MWGHQQISWFTDVSINRLNDSVYGVFIITLDIYIYIVAFIYNCVYTYIYNKIYVTPVGCVGINLQLKSYSFHRSHRDLWPQAPSPPSAAVLLDSLRVSDGLVRFNVGKH